MKAGNRVLLALQILQAFVPELDFSLGVDAIFIGHGVVPQQLDQAAREKLGELGFRWDGEADAWQTWM